MERQNYNSLQVATFLSQHPKVKQVNHPGLKINPSHSRAKDTLDGYGGMVSFEIDGSVQDADNFLANLNLFTNTASLGGVESLVTRPAQTSHSSMSNEDRLSAGIKDELIRMSIGIEDVVDLIADLDKAFDKI